MKAKRVEARLEELEARTRGRGYAEIMAMPEGGQVVIWHPATGGPVVVKRLGPGARMEDA